MENNTVKIVLIVIVAIILLYVIYVLAALYLAGKIINSTQQTQPQATYLPPYSGEAVSIFSTPGLN
jgi:uncharacterized SAM-binding protein YcdF (DUF218 family)